MIPKIIHQTWKSKEIPHHLRGFQKLWLHHHPEWEYRIWNDAANESLLAEHYPDFLHYFRSTRSGILMIDFVRMAYLHRYGGVYADLDYEVIKPLDDLLGSEHVILCREHRGIGRLLRGHDYVLNALMVSPPGHPLWLDAMHGMVRAFRPRRILERRTAYFIRLGVAVLDEHAEQRSRTQGDVDILPFEVFYPASPTERLAVNRRAAAVQASYGIHHYENSWRSPLARLVNNGRAAVQRCFR